MNFCSTWRKKLRQKTNRNNYSQFKNCRFHIPWDVRGKLACAGLTSVSREPVSGMVCIPAPCRQPEIPDRRPLGDHKVSCLQLFTAFRGIVDFIRPEPQAITSFIFRHNTNSMDRYAFADPSEWIVAVNIIQDLSWATLLSTPLC